jgi:hypothetical protein
MGASETIAIAISVDQKGVDQQLKGRTRVVLSIWFIVR